MSKERKHGEPTACDGYLNVCSKALRNPTLQLRVLLEDFVLLTSIPVCPDLFTFIYRIGLLTCIQTRHADDSNCPKNISMHHVRQVLISKEI